MTHQRPLKVLFFGNGDNVNLRLCIWSRAMGIDACIWRMDEDAKRGDPAQLLKITSNSVPDWLVSVPEIENFNPFSKKRRELLRYAENTYDLAIVSGWNALLASRELKMPKVLMPVGSELGHLPFLYKDKTSGTVLQRANASFKNVVKAILARRALKSCALVQETWPPYLDVLSQLGLSDRVLLMSIGEDCQTTRDKIDKTLLARLREKNGKAKTAFLWFSRLNYKDPSSPIYKGPERFIKALEQFIPELESGRMTVIMGDHGDESQDFQREIIQRSPVQPYIQWVSHLTHTELATYLSLPNAVLCSEFGPHNTVLSGISRDAVACGTVMINSTTDAHAKTQYGSALPRFYALSVHEVAEAMRRIHEFSEAEFRHAQSQVLEYGKTVLDYRIVLPKFFRQIIERMSPLFDNIKLSAESHL